MTERLFVGGPWDGERHEAVEATTLLVPIVEYEYDLEEVLAASVKAVGGRMVVVPDLREVRKTARYELAPMATDNVVGIERWFYRFAGWVE